MVHRQGLRQGQRCQDLNIFEQVAASLTSISSSLLLFRAAIGAACSPPAAEASPSESNEWLHTAHEAEEHTQR